MSRSPYDQLLCMYVAVTETRYLQRNEIGRNVVDEVWCCTNENALLVLDGEVMPLNDTCLMYYNTG